MDIKAKIEELVAKIGGDSALTSKFKSDPAGTVKSLIGDKLPDGALEKIVDGVKAKLNLGSAGGFLAKIKGLFKKK